MNSKHVTGTCIFLLIIAAAVAYETDTSSYSSGDLNITSSDDYLAASNDTLIINLTLDVDTQGVYHFNVKLKDGSNTFQNTSTENFTSSNATAAFGFSTLPLEGEQFDFTVEIRDEEYKIIYLEYMQTDNYTSYEKGISIYNVTDTNYSDSIRISFTANVTNNRTENLTVFLVYGDKDISKTAEVAFTTPQTQASIDFDNETIKSTHYNGIYEIKSILIDNKLFPINQNTSSYNYEDFATTSYIKNITSESIDSNGDNISEYLRFTFETVIKTTGEYTIQTALWTDEFVTVLQASENLSAGTHNLIIDVPAETVYSTYYVGEFVLPSSKLIKTNDTIDIYPEYETELLYYFDFDTPTLPDLTVETEIINSTAIKATITNNGDLPAFNAILDIFNDNISLQKPIAMLASGGSEEFTIEISDYDSLYAVADFSNLVDEEDETNNFAYVLEPYLGVNIDNMFSEYRDYTFGIILSNNGSYSLLDVASTLYTGDNSSITNAEVNLTGGESVIMLMEYEYSADENYTATLNASWNSYAGTGEMDVNIIQTVFNLLNLSEIGQEQFVRVFSFALDNNYSEAVQNVTWNISTGDGTVINPDSADLESHESIISLVEHNYTSGPGEYTLDVSANRQELYINDQLTVVIEALVRMEGLSAVEQNGAYRVFYVLTNNTEEIEFSNMNITFNTGESKYISPLFNLTGLENMLSFVEHNYSSSGNYTVNATVIQDSYKDSELIEISIG
jgi:hypothetical protein